MRIEWSVFALADRTEILNYIEAESWQAASLVDDRIESAVECLVTMPGMGRPGRIEGTRELIIEHTPYIAAYRIADDLIFILRVLHGAQQWPEEIDC